MRRLTQRSTLVAYLAAGAAMLLLSGCMALNNWAADQAMGGGSGPSLTIKDLDANELLDSPRTVHVVMNTTYSAHSFTISVDSTVVYSLPAGFDPAHFPHEIPVLLDPATLAPGAHELHATFVETGGASYTANTSFRVGP